MKANFDLHAQAMRRMMQAICRGDWFAAWEWRAELERVNRKLASGAEPRFVLRIAPGTERDDPR